MPRNISKETIAMINMQMFGKIVSTRYNATERAKVLTIQIVNDRKVGDKMYTDNVAVKIWGERALALKDQLLNGKTLLASGRPEATAFRREDDSIAAQQVLHAESFVVIELEPETK